jgi:PPOX class probable F420-dependent enzyme
MPIPASRQAARTRLKEDHVSLDPEVVRLAQSASRATVVTLMPDGQPQALLTWIDIDGEVLLVNTPPTTQRAKNIARDPRITILMHAAEDPSDWVEIRGQVTGTIGGREAREHLDRLSNRYLRTDYQGPVGPEGRIIFRVEPHKINRPMHPTLCHWGCFRSYQRIRRGRCA